MLSLVFYLLSALCFVIHDEDESGRVGRWYWLSLAAFVLAMLSKGSVAVLPAALLLIVWWRRRTITLRDVAITLPFFVIAAGFTGLNVWLQTRNVAEGIRDATLVERVLGAATVVWFYLYKAVLPIGLVFVYPQWRIDAGDMRWWLPLAAALLCTAALLHYRQRPVVRGLLFAWLYFIVALVPVMGLVDVYFMRYSLVADHYQYVAIIGVVAAVGALAGRRGPSSVAMLAAASGLVVVLGMLTWRESWTYRDVETLYRVTIARNPDAWLAHQNLGVELAKRPGHLEEAIESFKTVLRIYPGSVEAHRNLALAYWRTPGRTDDAIREYEEALRLNPNKAVDHLSLARLLLDRPGREADAMRHAEMAVRLDPTSWEALETLGGLLLSAGRHTEAAAAYRAAVERNPDAIASHLNLGGLLASQPGGLAEAIRHFETVIRLKPDHADCALQPRQRTDGGPRPDRGCCAAPFRGVAPQTGPRRRLTSISRSCSERFRDEFQKPSSTFATCFVCTLTWCRHRSFSRICRHGSARNPDRLHADHDDTNHVAVGQPRRAAADDRRDRVVVLPQWRPRVCALRGDA